MSPLTNFTHRRSCPTFRSWLVGWWDAGPWHLRLPEPFDRCLVGGVIDDSLQCRRRIHDQTAWRCRHHAMPSESQRRIA